jgi:hypothetical protein
MGKTKNLKKILAGTPENINKVILMSLCGVCVFLYAPLLTTFPPPELWAEYHAASGNLNDVVHEFVPSVIPILQPFKCLKY